MVYVLQALLIMAACAGIFLFVAVNIALWMAWKADGGAYCLWRFSLFYGRDGCEPWPGMGYRMDLDGDEFVRLAGEAVEKMA